MNCPKWPIQPKTKLNLFSVDPKWYSQILTPFKYKNVRCPIFLLRRREIDWFYFYVPNGRPESKKKPCTTEWTFHMQMSAIIRNSHIYKKRTEMLSMLFMALFIFISFPKGLYNINSIRPWNLKNRKKRHFLRRSLHLADRFSRVVFSNEL